MNKNKFYTLSIMTLASVALSSCDDTLEAESKSTFDESIVFSNETLTEYNIVSVYHSFGETNNYRGRYLPWYGFNTDIEWYNSSDGTEAVGASKHCVAKYSLTSTDDQLNVNNNPWAKLYEAIERANVIINGIRTYGNGSEKMNYLLGESLTLRALIYADIVKAWGDCPARFEPTTSDNIYVAKSSRDVIYKQILADLEEAWDYLPWPGESELTAKSSRINKAYAKGLYARIALAASGYALRPADGAVGTGDAGSIRLSSDSELSKGVLYPKALAACEDVIKSGSCKLYSDYQQLWMDQNDYDTNFDGEVLFVIPFSNSRGRWNYTFAVSHQNGSSGDQFCKLSGGTAGPTPNLYFEYDVNDTRRDVSCVNFRWSKNSSAVAELAGISHWYFGKYRYEWLWKNENFVASGNDDGTKPVYMRYSDILLMAAECANYLGDLGTATTYFKQVRDRAFGGDDAKAMANVDISSKDKMFAAIVNERAFEFVGEFLRKGDLIRWGMLSAKMNEAKEKMTALAKLSDVTTTATAADGTSMTTTINFSQYNGRVFYQMYDLYDDGVADESIRIYGLNPGETEEMGEGWTEYTNSSGEVKTYISESNLKTEKINALYDYDPDTHMYWPIFEKNLTDSQGSLVNDYGY